MVKTAATKKVNKSPMAMNENVQEEAAMMERIRIERIVHLPRPFELLRLQ
jgi:hypothetical protein